MSRVAVWLCLSAAGLFYRGVVHGFGASGIDHFVGPVWFGGGALLVHWLVKRRNAGVQVVAQEQPIGFVRPDERTPGRWAFISFYHRWIFQRVTGSMPDQQAPNAAAATPPAPCPNIGVPCTYPKCGHFQDLLQAVRLVAADPVGRGSESSAGGKR